MGKKLYEKSQSGNFRFKTTRKIGDVRIPNYVYDLWMPLVGATAIGVYGTYCRLEREGSVKAITMADLAKACRIGTDKLRTINETLEECGFVSITKPEGAARLMHFTTEITTHNPPFVIPKKLIEKLAITSGYEVLSKWLVEENDQEDEDQTPSSENLDGFSEEPNQALDEDLSGSPKVVALGLQPLEVAESEPSFSGKNGQPSDPTDFFFAGKEVNELTGPNPTDQHFRYGQEVERAFDELAGGWGKTAQQRLVQRDLLRGGVVEREKRGEKFDLAQWEQSIRESIGRGVGAGNIARFWEVYDCGGSYEEYLRQAYPKENKSAQSRYGIQEREDGKTVLVID